MSESTTITARIVLERGILAATDKEAGRYALGCALAEPASGETGPRLIATDGQILAIRETTGEVQAPALVPAGAFGKAPKKRERRVAELNGSWRSGFQWTHRTELEVPADGAELHSVPDGRFPQWRQVVPELPADSVVVSFDVNKLAKLVEAIGADDGCVALAFAPTNGYGDKPIMVIANNATTSALGVLMPLAANDYETEEGNRRNMAVSRVNAARERLTR